MDLSFLFRESPFYAGSASHLLPLVVFVFLGSAIIVIARRLLNSHQQKLLLLVLSFVPLVGQLLLIVAKSFLGTFSIQTDLPIHICRVLALVVPWVYWKENKMLAGICYFWIMVGTVNAIITPDLYLDFPHWEYLSYYLLHLGLIFLPPYYIFVLGHRITRRDLINAIIAANLFLVFSLIVNVLLDANYMFTMHKPEAKTLLDVLGPWPIYIFTTELLGIILFILAYLPFAFLQKNKRLCVEDPH